MKTKRHGNGMTHKQVIHFSNRLAASAQPTNENNEFASGWEAACRFFAHQLRKDLRFYEEYNEL